MAKTLLFAEQRDGNLHPAVFQLLTAARQINSAAPIDLCVLGSDVSALAETLARYDASTVIAINDPKLQLYRPQPYTRALQLAIEKAQPDLVLLAATFMGRDLAPRLAVRTRAALATDCIEAKLDADALIVKRPVYTGKATATVKLTADRLNIISIRPNTFAAAEPVGKEASIETLTLDLEPADEMLVNHEWVSTSSGVKDVTEADIIVSGGRPLKSKENFRIVYDLAQVLDAAVGASRAACDAGYQPHSRQVGLTGKTVTPKLYVALGIDGAIQHLAGMRGSRVIVAVNTKKDAPIFNVATYGCVADLFTMVPLLKEEFRKTLER